jgi:uncharacterized Ntn-hydrolase superfamily protein
MTYSIVARDPETGELGVAVQSHFFAVGSLVTWAQPGAGAVAAQAVVDPALGWSGLELMRGGASAPEAMHRLLAEDAHEAYRQVGMVDRLGRTAVHTGGRCIEVAGHRLGDQVSAQANMMRGDTVPDAMAASYSQARGDLANRLVSALEAAEREGGDVRGSQSAALLVVAGEPGESPLPLGKQTARPAAQPPEPLGKQTARPAAQPPYAHQLFDLRVDDHTDPVGELRRLLELKRAYDRVEVADELAAGGDMGLALEHYESAHEAQPDNAELAFWHGVALAGTGREDEARGLLGQAFSAGDGWRELLKRLPAAGLLPDDPALVERLVR